MKKSSQIKQEIAELRAEVEAIIATAEQEQRELLDDEQSRVDEILAEGGLIAQAESNLERALKIEANKAIAIRNALGDKLEKTLVENGVKEAKAPAKPKSCTPLRAFKDPEEAYASGQYIMAYVMGNDYSRQWCDNHGIKAAMTTGNNPKGGYLVPEPLEASIIELREQFGVFRRNSFVWPMGDSVQIVPRVNADVTTYYVGENSTITPSDMTLDQVKLEAKKLASLTAVSTELNEDSVIAVAELLARSVASQFANAEDQAGFNGDGTSTYGGIVGLKSALAAGSIQDAASGNVSFATLDLADFEAAVGKLKMYPGIMPKWYIHSTGFWGSMARLMDAAGGNLNSSLADGPAMQFLGYPVEFVQTMPSAPGVSTICAYIGDLRMGSYFGTRRGISVVADESFYFNQDAVAIRATQRYDINVHDRGTASASGCIIGLKTAAS